MTLNEVHQTGKRERVRDRERPGPSENQATVDEENVFSKLDFELICFIIHAGHPCLRILRDVNILLGFYSGILKLGTKKELVIL